MMMVAMILPGGIGEGFHRHIKGKGGVSYV